MPKKNSKKDRDFADEQKINNIRSKSTHFFIQIFLILP